MIKIDKEFPHTIWLELDETPKTGARVRKIGSLDNGPFDGKGIVQIERKFSHYFEKYRGWGINWQLVDLCIKEGWKIYARLSTEAGPKYGMLDPQEILDAAVVIDYAHEGYEPQLRFGLEHLN